jgi:hypothetical protein
VKAPQAEIAAELDAMLPAILDQASGSPAQALRFTFEVAR